MVSALLKVKRDKYDHYSHHALIFVVQRHNLYRGIYCASSYEVIFILDTYRLSIAYWEWLDTYWIVWTDISELVFPIMISLIDF
jgi:hypothetical protein